MNRLIARLLFCVMPALVFGGIVALFNVILGVLVFTAIFALGIECTKARGDRGEYD